MCINYHLILYQEIASFAINSGHFSQILLYHSFSKKSIESQCFKDAPYEDIGKTANQLWKNNSERTDIPELL